ncbi:fused MFS/spermidine synthase [Patescibacteria group bacterium]|nr:fused MFS/spermidine synthase [Patescibacteria group bacterium]
MTKNLIYLFVLIMGAESMALEMAMSRLFAPYFGTSLFVWGAIIGVVLTALSFGYWYGGKLADKKPDQKNLFKIGIVGSLIISLVTVVFDGVFSPFNKGVIFFEAPFMVVGLLILSLVLFSLPVFFFGMICPFAVRVISKDVVDSGKDAGNIFAFSTLGSILGVFVPSFVTIPYLGARETIFAMAFLGLLASLMYFRKRILVFGLLAVPIALYLLSSLFYQKAPHEVLAKETPYQLVRVFEEDGEKELIINTRAAVQSVYNPHKELLGKYWDSFSALPYLQDFETRHREVLILGVAGGTIPHQMRRLAGDDFDFDITGVEIDGELIDIARREFDYHETTVIADARAYLYSTQEKYDLIFIDTYGQEAFVPAHLATTEFFSLVKSKLSDQGIVAVNINAPSVGVTYYQKMANSFAKAFPSSYSAKVGDTWNYLFLGSFDELDFDVLWDIKNETIRLMAVDFFDVERIEYDPEEAYFSDNKSDIEQQTVGMYWEAIK